MERKTSDYSYDMYIEKITYSKREKQIRTFISIYQLLKVINVLYNLSLLMHVSRPLIMEEFYSSCNSQYFFAIFLDIGLSILAFSLQQKNYENLDLCNQFFFGYIVFWIGLKVICLLLYEKHSKCLFLDVYEYVLIIGIFDLRKFVVLFLIIEFVLYVYFYSYFLGLMKYYKAKFNKFIDYDMQLIRIYLTSQLHQNWSSYSLKKYFKILSLDIFTNESLREYIKNDLESNKRIFYQ